MRERGGVRRAAVGHKAATARRGRGDERGRGAQEREDLEALIQESDLPPRLAWLRPSPHARLQLALELRLAPRHLVLSRARLPLLLRTRPGRAARPNTGRRGVRGGGALRPRALALSALPALLLLLLLQGHVALPRGTSRRASDPGTSARTAPAAAEARATEQLLDAPLHRSLEARRAAREGGVAAAVAARAHRRRVGGVRV